MQYIIKKMQYIKIKMHIKCIPSTNTNHHTLHLIHTISNTIHQKRLTTIPTNNYQQKLPHGHCLESGKAYQMQKSESRKIIEKTENAFRSANVRPHKHRYINMDTLRYKYTQVFAYMMVCMYSCRRAHEQRYTHTQKFIHT